MNDPRAEGRERLLEIYEAALDDLETIQATLTHPAAIQEASSMVLAEASYDLMVALDEIRAALYETEEP